MIWFGSIVAIWYISICKPFFDFQKCPTVRTRPASKLLENILPTFGGFNPKSTLVAFALNLKVTIFIYLNKWRRHWIVNRETNMVALGYRTIKNFLFTWNKNRSDFVFVVHLYRGKKKIDIFFCCVETVQWSTHPDFAFPGGELEVRDTQIWKRGGGGDEFNEVNVTVSSCPSNSRCYFRVAAGNLSGYGSFKTTLPSSILLSGRFLKQNQEQHNQNEILFAKLSKRTTKIFSVMTWIFSFSSSIFVFVFT